MNQEDLIKKSRGMVIKIAMDMKARYGLPMELDDLIGEGIVGLVRAAKTYDPRRGCQFSTYAYPFIKGYIYQFIKRERRHNPDKVSMEVIEFEDDNPIKLEQQLGDSGDWDQQVRNKIFLKEVFDYVERRFGVTERLMLEWYAKGLTQTEIGNRLGITQVQVSRSLKKIRDNIKVKFN